MKRNGRDVVALLVFSVVVAVVALIALIFFVGAHVPRETRASERAFTELSIAILILGWFVMLAVFVVFVWIGIADWHRHAPLSRLYRPQVSVKGFCFSYMTMLLAELSDLQLHSLKPRWAFPYTPLAELCRSLLLLGLFLSFLWVAVVILRGRATTRAERQVVAAGEGDVIEKVTEVRVTSKRREGENPC